MSFGATFWLSHGKFKSRPLFCSLLFVSYSSVFRVALLRFYCFPFPVYKLNSNMLNDSSPFPICKSVRFDDWMGWLLLEAVILVDCWWRLWFSWLFFCFGLVCKSVLLLNVYLDQCLILVVPDSGSLLMMMMMIEWFDGWTRLVQVIWSDLVQMILWIAAWLRLLWFHCIDGLGIA